MAVNIMKRRWLVRGVFVCLFPPSRVTHSFSQLAAFTPAQTAKSERNLVNWSNNIKRTKLKQTKDDTVSFGQKSNDKSEAGSDGIVPVILDHDGGIDDFIALVVLASAQAVPNTYYHEDISHSKQKQKHKKIKLLGVTIVEADTYTEPCLEVCRRLLALYGDICPELTQIPIAASTLKGTASPFPDDWRKDSYILKGFPILNAPFVNRIVASRKPDRDNEGHELLGELVVNHEKGSCSSGITLVVTGPLTNVAYALTKHKKAFTDNIDRIIIMGGAAKVQGNVFQKNLKLASSSRAVVDGSAEWNIYWDAPSAKKVIEHPDLAGKLYLFPLDATNDVPVTAKLVKRFGNECCGSGASNEDQKIPTALAQFVGNAWGQVTYDDDRWAESSYYAWDVLTAAYVVDPTVVLEKKLLYVTIEARSGNASEGRTIVHDDIDDDNGKGKKESRRNVHVVMKVDAEKFYQIAVNAAKPI